MSEALVALLRHRVATWYYDQPRVVDAMARVMHRTDVCSEGFAQDLS